MKLLRKITLSAGMALLLGSATLNAATYTVKSGETLYGIMHKLGFNSIEKAGIKVPSGDINRIFPGDKITYKNKKKRFHKRKQSTKSAKFCFKNNHSIHYRVQERCK